VILLVDHNLEGQAVLLQGVLAAEGWIDLLSLRFVTLREVGLPLNSSDRTIWRFSQVQQMLLLTGNRRKRGADSLERTIHEENTLTSLPVITVSNAERMDERSYREHCGISLVRIILDLENYRGTGRIYLP
jgi:hypothetical protein